MKMHEIKIHTQIILICILVLIDQISKIFLIDYIKLQDNWIYSVNSFFDIVYVWNRGISFGLFRDYDYYSNVILSIINTLIVIYLLYFVWNGKQSFSWSIYGYIGIISGAIGNIIDRIAHGAVFDFIYLHILDYSFPVFNLADSFISIGAFIILLRLVIFRR
jgi:signal peptidase II